MQGLCDKIHGMGLKAGIYSTPWTTSYANHIGGSSENAEGIWEKPTVEKRGRVNKKILPWAIGKYHFATNDARQWAAWGIDYLKYDWNPNEVPETSEMAGALREDFRRFFGARGCDAEGNANTERNYFNFHFSARVEVA